MNNRYNFFAKARLDLCCSNDDFRPVLGNILFEDGKAIVTNGRVLIVTDISEISNLQKDDIDKLNGHLVNSKMYREILRYGNINITDDGIECVKYIGTLNEMHVLYKFGNKEDKGIFPKYKNIYKQKPLNKLSKNEFKTSFLCESINIILSIFNANHVDFKFSSESNSVMFMFDGLPNTYGMIMQSESECDFNKIKDYGK